MTDKPLKIVTVFEDNMVYQKPDNTMGTIEYPDIKSMDFSLITTDNAIQVHCHDETTVLLDNGDPKDHQLGQTYQSWLNAEARNKEKN